MRLASLASMPLTPLRLACHDYLVGKVGMSQCTTKAPRKFAWAEKPRYCKMILRLWSSSIVEVAAFYFSVHWLSRLRFPPNILWCAWISKLKQPFVDEITTPVKVVSFTTSMSRPFDVCYYFLLPEFQAALVMWFCWAKMLLLAQRSRWLVSSSNKPRLATTRSSNAAIKNAGKGRRGLPLPTTTTTLVFWTARSLIYAVLWLCFIAQLACCVTCLKLFFARSLPTGWKP